MIRPSRRADRYAAQYRFMGPRWRGWTLKYLSVKSRNRLLFVADRLTRTARRIREYVKAKTPPRAGKKPKAPPPPSPQLEIVEGGRNLHGVETHRTSWQETARITNYRECMMPSAPWWRRWFT